MFKFAFHPDIFCPFRRSFYRWQISFPFIIRLAGKIKVFSHYVQDCLSSDNFCPFRRSFYRWQIPSHFIIRLET